MKGYKIVLIILIVTTTGFSQYDTSCGIVWEPPIQLSPDSVAGYDPSIAVQGDTVHVTWWNSGLHFPYVRSTDGGKTFEPLRELAPDSVGFVGHCFVINSGNRLHGFFNATVASPPYQYYHTYSDDRGDSWILKRKFPDSLVFHNSTARFDTILFRSSIPTGHGYLLTKSFDGGITWHTDTCNELIGNHPQLALTKDYLHLVKGAGFDSAGIWSEFVIQYRRSTDLGKTWSDSIPLSTVNFTRAYEPHLAAYDDGDSSVLFAAWKDEKYGCLTWVGCSVLGRISRDNGNSFEPEIRFDEKPSGFAITPTIKKNFIAIIWNDDLPGGGLLLRISSDGGIKWSAPCLVSFGGEHDIAISNSIIHVTWSELIQKPDSTFNFVIFYRRGIILPTSIKEDRMVTNEFSFSENYPNPFNPKTLISFNIYVSSFTSLKVYDIFGREVATLINEKLSAGEHKIEFDGSSLGSGVYYYRLIFYSERAGIRTETKKMILLK